MLFSIILVCILNPEFGAVIKTLSLALPKFSVNILFEFLSTLLVSININIIFCQNKFKANISVLEQLNNDDK